MAAAQSTKDYYKVLGVADTASPEEVKRAYRKLAKRYHPDATGGDKAKESKFKEVSEAYETLGDEKKRAEYDTIRKNPFAAGRGGAGFPGGYPGGFGGGARAGRRGGPRVEVNDLNDLFGGANRGGGAGGFTDLFADLFRGGGGEEARPRPPAKGDDARSRVEVDLAVAALGGDLPLTVDGKRLTVRIPAGIDDGQTIRVAGHGQPGPAGPGDLLLDVHVRPHAQFRRKGDDLEVDVAVPVDQAILGAKVEVPTLEGAAKVTVPPSTSSGLKLRLRGKGARRRAAARPAGERPPDGERGDLYAIVQIVVPRDLPPHARELLEEFARASRPAASS